MNTDFTKAMQAALDALTDVRYGGPCNGPLVRDAVDVLAPAIAASRRICLLCGKTEPCMTEADLKTGDPGVPCTFDATGQELYADNQRLRAALAQVCELVQETFQARCSDAESGVRWLNEAASAKWAKENPRLLKAMVDLSTFVEPWAPA